MEGKPSDFLKHGGSRSRPLFRSSYNCYRRVRQDIIRTSNDHEDVEGQGENGAACVVVWAEPKRRDGYRNGKVPIHRTWPFERSSLILITV